MEAIKKFGNHCPLSFTHLLLFLFHCYYLFTIVTIRGVTRLDGARGKKQVWRPHVRNWGLSEANVLYWWKCLWHCWDFSAPPLLTRRPGNCAPLACPPRYASGYYSFYYYCSYWARWNQLPLEVTLAVKRCFNHLKHCFGRKASHTLIITSNQHNLQVF